MKEITDSLVVFLQALVHVTKVGADDEMPQWSTNNSCEFEGCEEIAVRMFECTAYKVFGGWTFSCNKHITPVLVGFMNSIVERYNEW